MSNQVTSDAEEDVESARDDSPKDSIREVGGVRRNMTWKESSEFWESFVKGLSKDLKFYKDECVELRRAMREIKDEELTDFYEFIKHGDEAHQAWIKGAIEGFFKVKLAR